MNEVFDPQVGDLFESTSSTLEDEHFRMVFVIKKYLKLDYFDNINNLEFYSLWCFRKDKADKPFLEQEISRTTFDAINAALGLKRVNKV